MTREEFATLVGSRPVILDGATGTNLQKAGMPVGVCPVSYTHLDVYKRQSDKHGLRWHESGI